MEGNCKGLIYQNTTKYFNQCINIKHQMLKNTWFKLHIEDYYTDKNIGVM